MAIEDIGANGDIEVPAGPSLSGASPESTMSREELEENGEVEVPAGPSLSGDAGSNLLVQEPLGLPPTFLPRRSDRINKGKARQRLEDEITAEEIHQQLKYITGSQAVDMQVKTAVNVVRRYVLDIFQHRFSQENISTVQSKKRKSVQTKKREDMVRKYMFSNKKRRGYGMSSSERMAANNIWMARQVEPLIPGISDNVTLTHISAKLPWRDFCTLSSVSHGWQQAFRSREVHNARVRTDSTETLVIVHHIRFGRQCDDQGVHVLSLYSNRDSYWYDLPPIPFCGGVPSACQHVSLDGQLYVLGGAMNPRDELGSKEVYRWDMAGQGSHWQRCASMREPRQNFGVGVHGGKLYVFGGSSLRNPVFGSEVYDPKVNAWYPIKPMRTGRVNHKVVATVGDDLVIYGGQYLLRRHSGQPFRRSISGAYFAVEAGFLDIYHTVEDKWRQIRPVEFQDWDEMFVAQGKFHVMSPVGMDVYDADSDSWGHLHSFLNHPTCGSRHEDLPLLDYGEVGRTIAVADELLYADVFYRKSGTGSCLFKTNSKNAVGCCLFKGKGFGSNSAGITWEKVVCHLFFDSKSSFMCTIQL